MKLTKAFAVILALVFCLSAFAACSGPVNYAENNTEFVIGLSGPLTGGAAMYGIAVQNAAQMAVDEINAAGGLNGVKFKLVAMDDKHDATLISTNYSALYEGGMQVSLGTVTTAPGLEFKNLSADDNVFFLTPSASGDDIPTNPNGYQMCFADGNQGKVAAEFVNANYKGQTIGAFYKSDEAYSKGIYDQFKANLDASITVVETNFTDANGYQMCFADGNQGKVAAEFVNANYKGQTIGAFYKSDEAYSKGIYDQFKANLDASVTVVETNFTDANTSDFSTQIDTLKNCGFIFMPTYYTPASLFMTQAKDILAADAVYYGCDGFDGIDNIDGFDITAIPQKVTMLSHFNSKATDGMAKEFIDKYVARFGADTLNQFGASAYDCVYAIYGAMKKAVDEGKDIPVTISASDLCEILKEQFNGGYTLAKGVTGENIKWETTGYVNKGAIQYVIKEANAAE